MGIGAGAKAWIKRRKLGAAGLGESGRRVQRVGETALLVETGLNGEESNRELDLAALQLAEAGLAGPELARAAGQGREAALGLFYAALATEQAPVLLSYAVMRAALLYEPGTETDPDAREATEWGVRVVAGLATLSQIAQEQAARLVAEMVVGVLTSGEEREEAVWFLAQRAAAVDRLTGGVTAERAIAAVVDQDAEALGVPELGYPVVMLLAILAAGHEEVAHGRLMQLMAGRPGVLGPLHVLLLALAGNSEKVIPPGPRAMRGQPAVVARVLTMDQRAIALLREQRVEEASALMDGYRAASERTQALACWVLANALSATFRPASR